MGSFLKNWQTKKMIHLNKNRRLAVPFRLLICGAALISLVLLSSNTKKQKAKEYSTAPLFDALPLPTKIDSSSLAVALARASGKAVVVVLPQETQNTLLNSFSAAKQPLDWKQTQKLLRQAGAIVGTENTGVLLIAQGTAYPLLNEGKGDCLTGELWKSFSDSYSQLTPEQQSALGSPDGLMLDVALSELPGTLKDTLKQFNPDVPSQKEVRARLSLTASIYSGLTEASANSAPRWWVWNKATALAPANAGEGPQVDDTVRFPDIIAFSSLQQQEWKSTKLSLPSGVVTLQQFTDEISRASGWTVKTDAQLAWPNVSIAGGAVTIGQLFQALSVSTSIGPRLIDSQKTIFLTSNDKRRLMVGNPSVTKDKYPLFTTLFEKAAANENVNFGPLAYGIVQIPVADVPLSWWNTVLSGDPPDDAFKRVGIFIQDGYPSYSQIQQALPEWRQLYAEYSLVSVPSLDMRLSYEVKTTYKNGSSSWGKATEMKVPMPLTCL